MDQEDKKLVKTVIKWAFGTMLVVGAGALALKALFIVPGAAVGVASRTLNADNIIHNYEWFHDTNAAFKARLGQIGTHSRLVAGETDSKEKSRLNMELAAMRQSCRELATRYNANATKTNRSIFMGREAPYELSVNDCEK